MPEIVVAGFIVALISLVAAKLRPFPDIQWVLAADTLGLHYEPGRRVDRRAMEGEIGAHLVRVRTARQDSTHGADGRPLTVYECFFARSLPVQVTVRSEGMLTSLWNVKGLDEFQGGEALFESNVQVKTSDEAAVRRFLEENRLAALKLYLQGHGDAHIDEHAIRWRTMDVADDAQHIVRQVRQQLALADVLVGEEGIRLALDPATSARSRADNEREKDEEGRTDRQRPNRRLAQAHRDERSRTPRNPASPSATSTAAAEGSHRPRASTPLEPSVDLPSTAVEVPSDAATPSRPTPTISTSSDSEGTAATKVSYSAPTSPSTLAPRPRSSSSSTSSRSSTSSTSSTPPPPRPPSTSPPDRAPSTPPARAHAADRDDARAGAPTKAPADEPANIVRDPLVVADALFGGGLTGIDSGALFESTFADRPVAWQGVVRRVERVTLDFVFDHGPFTRVVVEVHAGTGSALRARPVLAVLSMPHDASESLRDWIGKQAAFRGRLIGHDPFSRQLFVADVDGLHAVAQR